MERRGAVLLFAMLGIALCSAIVLIAVQGAVMQTTSPPGQEMLGDRAVRLRCAHLEERSAR